MKCIDCAGAPRDLGRDQGVALAEEVRADLARQGWPAGWRGRWLGPRPGAALWRDLRRYFPHQSEWLEGLALGADVPVRALLHALQRSCGPQAPQRAALASALAGVPRLATPASRGSLLRRVAPEGRFASIELCWPSASWAQLGVNEAGLAVAVCPRGSLPGRFAAPAALFARDCLERFERVDPALEWCLSRPAAVGGALLLADASGEIAGVDTDGVRRRALRPSAGWLLLGAPELEAASLAKPESLADPGELESALVAGLGSAAPDAGPAVIADPVGRRLRVAGEGGWLGVEG